MDNAKKILILEDVIYDLELILIELEKANLKFEYLHVETEDDFRNGILEFKPDLILSDYMLPTYDGMSALLLGKQLCPLTPIIIVTGSMNEETAVECMKAGADDYVIKEHIKRLNSAINNVIEKKKVEFEKIAVQKELREDEERHMKIFQFSHDSIILHDLEMNILDANNKAVEQFGYSKSELLKMKVLELHPKSEVKHSEQVLAAINKTDLLNVETKFVRKDGSVFFAEATPCKYTLGNKPLIHVVIRDITEQKKSQEELDRINKFNKTLIETIPFGMDIVNMEGNVLFMNNLLKDAIGADNPKGKCWEYYKDNGKQCTDCPLKQKMEIGELNICEVHNVFGGREYEITHTAMEFNGQKAMLEIFKDITEIKESNKKIKQLSRAIEQSPEMVVIADIDGNIEYANKRVTEITGYTQEEIMGKSPRIFQSGETSKSTYRELWDTILNGEIWEGQLLNKRKNEEKYWESLSISPVNDNKNGIINFVSIKSDITELVNSRDELIRAKEKAEEMSRVKSNFLANMSHELRTPLVGILGFTEILSEEIEDKELSNYAEMIHESGMRLLETVSLILDISKIESAKINIELSKVDVIKNIRRSIELFKIIAAKNNLYIKVVSDIKKIEMELDERMFDQIILNLLNNAVKFTSKGGVTVAINKIKNNTILEIKIKDTGIGIPQEKQKFIWEEFRQASEGRSRLYEGSGLGLTVTREYVKKLNGELRLESQLGVGSTFTVLLPINNKKELDETIKQIPIPNSNVNAPVINSTYLSSVLYLEDDESNQAVVKLYLRNISAVDIADNLSDGISKIKNKTYDLILADINLKSNESGVDFLNSAKTIDRCKNTPIIAITAYALKSDKEKYLKLGFNDYLSKPFSNDAIISLIKETLKI